MLAIPLFSPSERWTGTVFFTGLDDSAQCALARSLEKGAPLVFHDDAFAAVPPEVRPALLYRPAARKTRDLAHQVHPHTFVSRPFFQPFLPWLRAHVPGLPAALAVVTALLVAFYPFRSPEFRTTIPNVLARFWLIIGGGLALIPWLLHFPTGPYAEGPATLLAMLALTLVFFCGRTRAPTGIVEGLLLGLAATFHPTLAIYAVPIVLFSILRRGSWRHTFELAFGAVLGLAPLVLSTRYIAAPYGNFLDPATLRQMIQGSADIQALVLALAAALPIGIALLAFAHSPRPRAAAARPRFRIAVALASAFVIALALLLTLLHPAARRALAIDRDDILLAIPHIVAAVAMTLVWRRPATCALLAGCTLAALPFFVIQGQEVHVGIWSLRRALPPFAILPLAAFLGAFERDAEEAASKALSRRRNLFQIGWLLLLMPLLLVQMKRMRHGETRGELGATALVDAVDARLQPGALYLFERIPEAAPFAGIPGREVFGLNDRLSNELGHAAVVRWLRDEAAKRPVYVVALREVAVPIPEDGIVLVPEGEPVSGTLRRAYGKTFHDARMTSTTRVFSFLRVWPTDAPEARAALAAGTLLAPGAASPFGLAPGAWDLPRRGREGRWAADGAAFWGRIPAPGETIRFHIRASWWTRDGTNAPPQTLRLEAPFAGTPTTATLAPSTEVQEVVLGVTRDAVNAVEPTADTALPSPPPALGLYRLRGAETYDERGFPPALVAEIMTIQSE